MTETTPSPSGPAAPRRRIWLRALLFVSLALNLAVAGVVAGAWLNRSDPAERPERISRELGLGPFLVALEPGSRDSLKAAASARRGELAEGRRAWRMAASEAVEILREEPFDEARFMALVELQAEIAARGRMIGQQELARHLAAMTPEARAAFADKLERAMRIRGPGHRGGKKSGEPRRD